MSEIFDFELVTSKTKIPPVALTVEYDGVFCDGHILAPKFCAEAPLVSYEPHSPDSLYTLLLLDPDAPSRMKVSVSQ
jgi:hypothetical protein